MLYHVKISCFKAFDDNERTLIFEGTITEAVLLRLTEKIPITPSWLWEVEYVIQDN